MTGTDCSRRVSLYGLLVHGGVSVESGCTPVLSLGDSTRERRVYRHPVPMPRSGETVEEREG